MNPSFYMFAVNKTLGSVSETRQKYNNYNNNNDDADTILVIVTV